MKEIRLISALVAVTTLIGAFAYTDVSASENVYRLKDDAIPVWDDVGEYYKGAAAGTTAAEFLGDFDGEYIIKDYNGKAVPDDAPIGSDYTIVLGDNSRRIVVAGDVNRDACVSVGDVTAVLKYIAKWEISLCLEAIDVNLDGKLTLGDASLLLKYLTGWDVELGFVSWKHDVSQVFAPYEDSTLEMYFTHSTVKESSTDSKPNGVYSYDLYMAKNEYEGCHINLYSKNGYDGLYVYTTDFTGKTGDTLETELFFEDYMPLESGEVYPDRLPPIDVKNGFSISADTAQGLFLKVKTDFDTTPGMYRARIDVKNGLGQTVKRAYVYTYVWNFEIPEEPSTKTAFGMSAYSIQTAHRRYSGDFDDLYAKYYEYFLENRITPWCMPYSPTDDRADQYMSDPRVTSFLVYGGYDGDMYGRTGKIDDSGAQYLEEAYAKISANTDYAKKALFYMNDEPRFGDQLAAVAETKSFLDSYFPNARILVPMHVAYEETGDMSDAAAGFDNENKYPEFDGMDTYSVIEKYSTVMCPSVKLFPTPDMTFDGTLWYTEAITEKFGTLRERLLKSQDNGKEAWWYCGGSSYISLERTGMTNRTLFWGQYTYNIDGFLSYATTEWGNVSVRPNVPQRPLGGKEGILVYSGNIYGIDGPIACLRAEIVRDGLEDYEYLVLCETLLGKDTALEYGESIFADMVTFEKDPEVLETVRRKLGFAIEAALCGDR